MKACAIKQNWPCIKNQSCITILAESLLFPYSSRLWRNLLWALGRQPSRLHPPRQHKDGFQLIKLCPQMTAGFPLGWTKTCGWLPPWKGLGGQWSDVEGEALEAEASVPLDDQTVDAIVSVEMFDLLIFRWIPWKARLIQPKQVLNNHYSKGWFNFLKFNADWFRRTSMQERCLKRTVVQR